MNFRYESGIVLMLMLILLMAISYLSVCMMVHSLLVVKTVVGFHKQLLLWVDTRNQLLMAESAVQKNPEIYQESIVSFVPDHLEFNCENGVLIFQVDRSFLQSFVVVR